MCEAGRIRHHLKYNPWRPESTVLFGGYQVAGTPSDASCLTARGMSACSAREIKVSAHIEALEGDSGHADKNMLIEWLRSMNGAALGGVRQSRRRRSVRQLCRIGDRNARHQKPRRLTAEIRSDLRADSGRQSQKQTAPRQRKARHECRWSPALCRGHEADGHHRGAAAAARAAISQRSPTA